VSVDAVSVSEIFTVFVAIAFAKNNVCYYFILVLKIVFILCFPETIFAPTVFCFLDFKSKLKTYLFQLAFNIQ